MTVLSLTSSYQDSNALGRIILAVWERQDSVYRNQSTSCSGAKSPDQNRAAVSDEGETILRLHFNIT